jgi:hypothetical protein
MLKSVKKFLNNVWLLGFVAVSLVYMVIGDTLNKIKDRWKRLWNKCPDCECAKVDVVVKIDAKELEKAAAKKTRKPSKKTKTSVIVEQSTKKKKKPGRPRKK